MANRSFESLRVWQGARVFVNEIYDIMESNKDWGFRDQIQRAAVSIMNNIAEGCDSGSDAKYVNFLHIARGSCSEVCSMLYICLDRHFIEQSQFEHLLAECKQLNAQLYKLTQSLTEVKSPRSEV